MKRLGIAEFKSIVDALQQKYACNLTDYAFTSLKMRLEQSMNRFNFSDVEDFIMRLNTDAHFFEQIIYELAVPETELFRDPGMWQKLRDTILPSIAHKNELSFLVPESTNGYELYTLMIVLREKNLLSKSNFTVTHPSKKITQHITNRIIDGKRYDVNEANYSRYGGLSQFSNYVVKNEINITLEESLFRNVLVLQSNIFETPLDKKFDFVLFRNKMLYYNSKLQCQRLSYLTDSLYVGGFLAVGINENISDCMSYKKLLPIDKKEQLYKKVS